MQRRVFAVYTLVGVLAVGLLVPAAWADSHDEIMGIQWQWAGLTETEPTGQSVVPNPENFLLILNADGSANLKADCNMVRWTYTLVGDSLAFNTLGPSTRAYCGEESLDQHYMALLGKGGMASVEEARLILELNENAGRMAFHNGGPAETGPETMPETGGAPQVATWAVTALTGFVALGAGAVLRQRGR